MPRQINTEALLKYVDSVGNVTQGHRSHIKRMSAMHDTPDMRRLSAKLDDPEIERIYNEGVELCGLEGLDESQFLLVDLKEVKVDLGKDIIAYDYEARKIMVEDVEESLLECISFARLDWTWDFMWSYHLWPVSKFADDCLRLYGLIRGPRPRGLHARPFQYVLNYERKRRIRKWETKISRAAIRGDDIQVKELSKCPEVISRTKAPRLVTSD